MNLELTFIFQPSYEAHRNVECRLRTLLTQKNQVTIADRYSLRSSLHFNQSHVLTLFHSTGIRDHWHAHWLSQEEVAPPTGMLFELINSASQAKTMINSKGMIHVLFY